MNRVALLFSNDELAQRLQECVAQYVDGWAVDAIHSRVDTLSHVRRLDQAIQARHYDLVMTDTTVGPGLPAQLGAWLGGIPSAVYLRGWGDYTNYHGQYKRRKMLRIKAKTRFLFRAMDGKAAISEALIAGMSNEYPMGDAVVLERPYDVERFSGGVDLSDDETTNIITVTNLRYAEKRDGVLTVMDAVEPLLEVNTDLQYHVLGGGRHYDTIESRAEENPQMHAPGYMDDITDHYASADLFVYVSFLDGAPSTVYEAQAAGLPIIGGDAAGVPEAVGDAGLVVPPEAGGVRAAINEVLSNDSLRHDLADASRQKMATHNERVTSNWVDFWWGLIQ